MSERDAEQDGKRDDREEPWQKSLKQRQHVALDLRDADHRLIRQKERIVEGTLIQSVGAADGRPASFFECLPELRPVCVAGQL